MDQAVESVDNELPEDPAPSTIESKPEPVTEIPALDSSVEQADLLKLKEAIAKIPPDLRKEMEELLRVDFREVRPWTPPEE